MITAADVQRKASEAAFGKPLITNVHRGLIAEAIVALALEPEWRWCSEDYYAWDFERGDGLRLEVKQSAARQSWTPSDAKPSRCSFDIGERTGRWVGSDWIEQPGRNADLYVFAHHPIFEASADHRNPDQWYFYVVPTSALPATKRIALTTLRQFAEPCSIDGLANAVKITCASLRIA